MKIGSLSGATGVSVATLKYYLREGLLHPGVSTAINQSEYDDHHVRRVRLIRALLDLGKLGIADIARVLEAVDDDAVAIHDAFGVAQDAMVPRLERGTEIEPEVIADVDRFIDRHGLHVRADAEVRRMFAGALMALRSAGWDVAAAWFDASVRSAVANARIELAFVPSSFATRAEQMETTVIGTIAYEVAANAIRRIALEDASWHRFGPGTAVGNSPTAETELVAGRRDKGLRRSTGRRKP